MSNLWLLPDGIEELLPDEAMRLEQHRRNLIDLCYSYGYELVSPPLLEHLDSLLRSGGEDLELQTFKLIDHSSGRQLGIRADMTPQIARIDAHLLSTEDPARLCYAGPVLRARAMRAFEHRELFQVGAELFGSNHPQSDAEVIELMMQCLSRCGLPEAHLDIGHVGIFRSLVEQAGLTREQEAEMFDALQRKSIPDLETLVSSVSIAPELANVLVLLPDLRGSADQMEDALNQLSSIAPGVKDAADNLRSVVATLQKYNHSIEIHFDLSELRGYHYHTGVVFSAFITGHGREIARGGRYDAIGAVYGRSRTATGFSLDLRQILKLDEREPSARGGCIFAPAKMECGNLNRVIEDLRRSGERVVRGLTEDSDPTPGYCNRRLVEDGESWKVEPISNSMTLD